MEKDRYNNERINKRISELLEEYKKINDDLSSNNEDIEEEQLYNQEIMQCGVYSIIDYNK